MTLELIFDIFAPMKTLISVCGTTGIGKTALSIALAKNFGTQIISCDSRQFFREMKIGTAAPSATELKEVPHHFIGHLSVADSYSIGQFEIEALAKLDELFAEHPVVVMIGGSMMYEKAILEGLHHLPEASEENQAYLQKIWQEKGIETLQDMLKKEDPEYYETVDLHNPRRLLRALDVIRQTGKSYSAIISEPKAKRSFQSIRIGIEAQRDIIYDRINSRVDQMMQDGLVEEVKQLVPFRNHVALKTVGYTELFNYFDGVYPLETAVEEIKKNSRRFAKRQLTWYRKETNINWVNFESALQDSLSLLRNSEIQY